mgnify:CR=1 FL=1|jgi:hypothetical protein
MINQRFVVLAGPEDDNGNRKLGIPNKYHSRHREFQEKEFQDSFNTHDQFEFKELEEIPNRRYIVYFNIYNHMTNLSIEGDDETKYSYDFINNVGGIRDNIKIPLELPESVLANSLKGNVTWIINHNTESEIEILFHYDMLIKTLGCIEHPSNIILTTAAEIDYMYDDQLLRMPPITLIHFNKLIGFLRIDKKLSDDFLREKLNDINNKKIVSYKSLCYNRVPRNHRAFIISHMMHKGYTDDSIYSLGLSQGNVENLQHRVINGRLEYLRDVLIELHEHNKDIVPVMEEDVDLTINQAHSIYYKHALHSSFQIVTESCTSEYTFITEKSYKPFEMLQPFIQLGSVNNIKRLREMGYRVFDKWINHDYDSIRDDEDRLLRFLEELDRLHNIDQVEWAQMLYEMREDLYHNFNLIRNKNIDIPPSLLPMLYDFVNKDAL